MDWKSDLFDEKSLWAVFWRSPGFKDARFNMWVTIVAFALLIGFVFWDRSQDGTSTASSFNYTDTIRSWASLGFGFAVTILGFLLAGFTIFATITKPELFVALAKETHPRSGLSLLKYAFFTFLNVFSHYLSFLALTLVILLLGDRGGPLSAVGNCLASQFPEILHAIKQGLFVLIGGWFAVLVLKLKSIIWNIYQIVLLSIAHAAKDET
ncbi:hypothetical protein [Pelagibius sp.]|uniref:hypothetical protein n=1 Tax=Pelagibius sp. TaxID=1931238 RepID=UPI003B504F9F